MAKFIQEFMSRRGAGNVAWPYITSTGDASWFTIGECLMGYLGPGASDIRNSGFAYIIAPYNVDVVIRPQAGPCLAIVRADTTTERLQAKCLATVRDNGNGGTWWAVNASLQRVTSNGAIQTLAGPFYAEKPTSSVPNEVRLVANYDVVQLYVNGSLVATASDPNYASRNATRHGVGHQWQTFAGESTRAEIDNFTLTKLNMPPLAPSGLSPSGSNRRADQNLTLQWLFNDNDEGDAQSKADVLYSLGGSALTTQTVQGTAQSLTLPANSLYQGDYVWQVRAYDAAGVPGPITVNQPFTLTGPRTGLETYNLAAALNASATSITLLAGQGKRFPAERTGGYYLDLEDGASRERVLVEDRVGTTLYLVRAQSGTTARAHPSTSAVRYDDTVARPANYVQPTSVAFSDVSLARTALDPQYNDPAGGKVVASTSTALPGGVWYRNTVTFETPRAIIDARSGAANVAAPDLLAVGVSAYGDLPTGSPYKITGVQLSAPARTGDGVDFAVPGQAVVRVNPTRLNYAPNANLATVTTSGWEVPPNSPATLSTSTTKPWVGARSLVIDAPATTEPGGVVTRMALDRLRPGRTYHASARVYTNSPCEIALRTLSARDQTSYAAVPDARVWSDQVSDANALGADKDYRLVTTSFTTAPTSNYSWTGKPGASVSVEDIDGVRRVNLCPNPAVTRGTGGWRPTFGGERSAERARSGSWSMRTPLTASSTIGTYAPSIPCKTGSVALSAWVWSGVSLTVRPTAQVVGPNGSIKDGTDVAVPARTWTRLSLVVTVFEGQSVSLRTLFTGGGVGNFAYVTDVLYEEVTDAVAAGQSGVRPYFDGDSGANALLDVVVTPSTPSTFTKVYLGGMLVEERPGGDFFDHTTGVDYLPEAAYPDGSGRSFYYANYRLGAKALEVAMAANTAAHIPAPLVQFARLPSIEAA